MSVTGICRTQYSSPRTQTLPLRLSFTQVKLDDSDQDERRRHGRRHIQRERRSPAIRLERRSTLRHRLDENRHEQRHRLQRTYRGKDGSVAAEIFRRLGAHVCRPPGGGSVRRTGGELCTRGGTGAVPSDDGPSRIVVCRQQSGETGAKLLQRPFHVSSYFDRIQETSSKKFRFTMPFKKNYCKINFV